MKMHRIISKIISAIKSEPWELDQRIPVGYLSGEMFRRACMTFRGMCVFGRIKPVIQVGRRTQILAKSLFRFEGPVSIDRNCHINALSKEGIRFGKNVSIGKNTVIECSGSLKDIGVGLVVGNNVGLGQQGFFGCAGGVKIGDDCIFGNYVSIHAENHQTEDITTPMRLQGVHRLGVEIGPDCWIGAKVTVLDGARIGRGSIVAAGAVVTKGEYPDYAVLGGVPARVIGNREMNK